MKQKIDQMIDIEMKKIDKNIKESKMYVKMVDLMEGKRNGIIQRKEANKGRKKKNKILQNKDWYNKRKQVAKK